MKKFSLFRECLEALSARRPTTWVYWSDGSRWPKGYWTFDPEFMG